MNGLFYIWVLIFYLKKKKKTMEHKFFNKIRGTPQITRSKGC